MNTNGTDPRENQNFVEILQRQSLKVEFHLDHTDYKKLEVIGTGAYGVVCSAINRKTRQKVAIKKIPNIFTMDPRYAIRTYREIKILQHFKHDNVIGIREIVKPVTTQKDVQDVYVVMDLMESDLHRIIYSKQSLTEEHVKFFLYQVLRGLKYIHSANVIHRDLKPSNLLVNANCELKIGDFGMARGLNMKSETRDYKMTQYVATRWYRAPELIISCGYGAAIDMWSVGCIFAEMLNRKHLFPGKNMLDQFIMIIKTLGKPSQEYIQSLGSENIAGIIKSAVNDPSFKPKSFSEICPKASVEAISLLAKMLTISPNDRMEVNKALQHPYLSKYHSQGMEPVATQTFDFKFEAELYDLPDTQKRIRIKDLLMKEVLTYHKPEPIDFSSLISPSTETKPSNSSEDPYADLNAFLAEISSDDPKTTHKSAEKSATNALLQQTSKQLPDKTTNPLLTFAEMTQTKPAHKSLFDRNKLFSMTSADKPTTSNSLLEQSKPTAQLTHNNQLLKPLNNSTNALLHDVKPDRQTDRPKPTDKLLAELAAGPGELVEERKDSLLVSTNELPGADDIEMLSAKLEQTTIGPSDTTQKSEEPMDAKSLLRQRLMKNKKEGNVKTQQEKVPPKSTITAYQRQKEREEKRRKRIEAQQKKKKVKPQAGPESTLLTTEDRKLLEKWTNMAKQSQTVVKTTVSGTNGQSTSIIIVHPAASPPTGAQITTSNNPAITNTFTTQNNSNQVASNPNMNPLLTNNPTTSQQLYTNTQGDFIPITSSFGSETIASTFTAENYQNGDIDQPRRTFSDLAESNSWLHQLESPFGDETGLYDPIEPFNTLYRDPNQSAVTQTQSSVTQTQPLVGNNTNIQTSWQCDTQTSLDINVLRNHQEGIPPMLVSTPKGTGGGYGVGPDLETFLTQNPDIQLMNQDSAPLSAALSLADLMDFGNLDQSLDLLHSNIDQLDSNFPFGNY